MALIGKIREKSWLLVLIVGLALLAFIMTDYKSMLGGSQDSIGQGTVYGEPVSSELYSKAVENYTNMDAQNAYQQQRQYTEKDRVNSESKAWKAIVDSIILQREFNALGIDVSDNEFEAYLYGTDGFSVLPDIQQSFIDPKTGVFSLQMLKDRIDQMQSSTDPNELKMWEDTKKSLKIRRTQEKYFGLLNQGIYVTQIEAKNDSKAKEDIISVDFILKRFTDIKDADITITDDELKAYYEEHKNDAKYKVRRNEREVKYFGMDIVPSSEDTSKIVTDLNKLKEKLEAGDAKADSILVVSNSDTRFYSSKVGYRKEGSASARPNFTYPESMDSVFENAAIGTVIGPYEDGEYWKIAEVIDVERQLLTVRHILIPAQRIDTAGVEKAQATVDSLMGVVNKDNFEELVTKHSQDPGSKETGGKYEDFIASEMVPEFSNFAVNKPIGTIGYVQTDYGFHIMEVLDRKAGVVPQLAVIAKTLKPSSVTIDDIQGEAYDLIDLIYDEMNKVEALSDKVMAFDSIAREKDMFARSMNLNEENIRVNGMNTIYAEDKIVELAFNEEHQSGKLASAPIKDGERFVIAMLSLRKDEGVPSFDAAQVQMRRDLMEEKKNLKFTSQMTGKSIEELEKSMNITKRTGDVTFANNQIPGSGFEPEIVGMLFSGGLKVGQTTTPLQGRTGTYVIRINSEKKAPVKAKYDEEKAALLNTARTSVQNTALQGLKELANVIDNRRLLKVGVRR